MGKSIKDVRRRLTAISTPSLDATSPTSATSLADCRVAQSRLRELKREVLARITDERSEIRDLARESQKTRPSITDGWRRRQKEAKKLLAGVQDRVIKLVDGDHGKALKAWTALSEEIDERLNRLEELEPRLERAARAPRPVSKPPPVPRQPPVPDDADDNLYAAVGAAVQKGEPSTAFCPHCGQGVETDDRFCRRCGHRLDAE